MSYVVTPLAPNVPLESLAILRKLPSAHRHLAELKGMAATIPNENILISTLALQEAKDSSAIENIITTHDELYKAQLFGNLFTNAATKEVNNYAEALRHGFELIRKHRFLSTNHILDIQQRLEQNDAGFRRVPGTALINEATKETVYTPPQDYDTIARLMDNLTQFINDNALYDADPLVKMAVLHFQFESIHPFYDGNGRTGRILNILYLVLNDLLDLPILYLSRYIIRHKADYYRLLQQVRDTGKWEDWILYMLDGVEQTARDTKLTVVSMRALMQQYKHGIRNRLKKIYSQDLLNNLFRHPYTKIEFLMVELDVSRITATRYLNLLTEHGFLEKQKISGSTYYINMPLYHLFTAPNPVPQPTEPIKTIHTGRV